MGSFRLAMVLAAALLGVGQALAAEDGDDGFGRWESTLRRCQLQWPKQGQQPAQQSPCLKIRLDQTIEGMLRVRFINGLTSSRYASEELTFAGLLLQQDQPMRCRGGSCQPSWPLRLQVHGVASRRFDPRGLAEQLPQNQLAKGSCQLNAALLQCQARGLDGQRWQASAQISEPVKR
ncbi:MAG: hypothetical protein RLZZ336_273 [Cyanobacteriota bacterium]